MQSYDPLTPAERSERMSLIRNADTKPEMIVRRLIHGMGYRYRLHSKDLPGHPDLVFRPRKKVVLFMVAFGTSTVVDNTANTLEAHFLVAEAGREQGA